MVKWFSIILSLSVAASTAFGMELPTPETLDTHRYQLVIVSYGDQTVDRDVQQSLALDFVTAMGQLGLSALSVDSMKNLQVNFKNFHDQLALAVMAINGSLPEDQPMVLNFVYLPLSKESLVAKNKTLQPVELSGSLSSFNNSLEVKSLKVSLDAGMGDTEFDWYTSVSNSLALHNQKMSEKQDSPGFFFSALQMQMSLQKDNSNMQLQIMVGLNGQKVAIDQVNDQVRIQTVTVPQFTEIIDQNADFEMAEAPGYFSQAPVAVLSTAFEQAQPEKDIELSMSLGAFNGLGGNHTGVDVVDEFAIAGTALPSEVGPQQWIAECQDRMKSVPALNGTLAKGAVGGGTLGELVETADVAIDFHFFNLWFQFNEAGEPYIAPGNLDVRVALAGGLGGYGQCVVMGQVNEQLAGEINSTIRSQLEEMLQVDSLADELLSQF